MTNFELAASIIFFILLTIFISSKKKNLKTKRIFSNFYFSMYRAKWGISLMDSLSDKFRKFWMVLGYIGIIIGFLGMILICFTLIDGIVKTFTKPEAAPVVGLVLPIPVEVPGIFGIPFSYWIISIFIIALVHEFSHGLIARTHKMKIKSSGFAFVGVNLRLISFVIIVFSAIVKFKKYFNDATPFYSFDFSSFSADFWLVSGIVQKNYWVPIIPVAFVEPDEKETAKRPAKEQLSLFAAGPLANIAFGFLFLGILIFAIAPLANSVFEPAGVKIVKYVESNETFPAERAGINIGEVIIEADGQATPFRENLSSALKAKKPGDVITIRTNNSTYKVKLANNPENESSPYLGAYLDQEIKVRENIKTKYGKNFPNLFIWFIGLIEMLITLNFGIGLFNLVPLGPLDGGRMFSLAMINRFGKDKGQKIIQKTNMFLGFVLLIYLFIILKNILVSFI